MNIRNFSLLKAVLLLGMGLPVGCSAWGWGEIVIKEFGCTGPGNDSGYGESLLTGWDFNDDGYPDIAAGAYLDDGNGTDAGRVFIYLERTGMVLVLSGEDEGDGFGLALGTVDWNGDGAVDLLVGAPWARGDTYGTGAAYLFLGGALLDSAPDLVFPGSTVDGRTGYGVEGIGDFNGDGFEDVAVGSPFNVSWEGRVDLYYGGPNGDDSPDLFFEGPVKCGRVGYSVAPLGDINGDGFDDFVAGAPTKRMWTDDEIWPEGRVYLFFGGCSPDMNPDRVFKGIDYRRLFGFDLAGPGDFNGDGINDVAIGAPRKKSYPPLETGANGTDPGHVWIYYGSTDMDTTADLVLAGENPDDAFGASLVFRDIDLDGFDDLLIGAPENDSMGIDAGAIYLFPGASEPDTIPVWKSYGNVPGGRFGFSCSAGCSINGDLFPDFGTGAVDEGRIHIFGISEEISRESVD